MSLIMDALKKAQQLQSKGGGSSPLLKGPHPGQKKERRSIKHWILIGTGFVLISSVLLILMKPGSPPLATGTKPIMPLMDKNLPIHAAEKISTEPSQEISISTKDTKPPSPVQALNLMNSKQTPDHHRSGQVDEEKISLTKVGSVDQPPSQGKQAMHKKDLESPIKQRTEQEKLKPPPPPEKEVSLSKSIGVEQEGGKGRGLMMETLNQFNLGVTLYRQKEFSKAIQAYQRVIELDPTYVEAYNNLGITCQTLGEMEKAVEFYQRSIEINPRYEKGLNNLGILLFLKGRYEQAQEVFGKVLDINPDNIETHIHLGILLKKKGEWGKAIESYQKALAINPLHGETHYNIALLYEQLENLELAVGHYQQFIRLSSKSYPELVLKVQRHLDALVRIKGNRK